MPEKAEGKRIFFIINPISGKRKKRDISKQIIEVLNNELYDISIQYTMSAGHAKQLSRHAIDNNADIIVAVGGDGTINEVASQIVDTEIVLGIIPLGSGNGLARHLGIPMSVIKALKLIKGGHFIRIDTATINDVPFISIAGVGFDALVARKFAKKRSRGFLTYFNVIANEFLSYKPKKYELFFEDRKPLHVEAFFISLANSNQFGYNTKIAPNAQINDGKLDICIVKKPHVFDIPRIANLLLLKKIDQSENVKIVQTTRLIIKQKKNKYINIDGEPIKLSKELNIRIKPLSLNVIIPKNA